jgi:hypothetical protein
MAFFVALWALFGAGYFWPVWPMLIWGVPTAFQAIGWKGGGCSRSVQTTRVREPQRTAGSGSPRS